MSNAARPGHLRGVPLLRPAVVGLLVLVIGATSGCSTTVHPSTAALPVCSSDPGHYVGTGGAETYTTATAPCAPTTTTSTTIPAPMALGASATLTDASIPDEVRQITITISRIWTGVAPVSEAPGFDLGQALRFTHAPATVQWIGVDVAMANTGQEGIAFASASGPGAATLSVVVNGQGPGEGFQMSSILPQIGFAMGVADCPYAFTDGLGLAAGSQASGCLAIPVPEGIDVASLGFDLAMASGGAAHHVAQWRP